MHLSLREYLFDRQRRDELVEALGTSYDYLWQIATGWRGRRASPDMALRIERHTNGVVPRWITRPDLWDAPAKAA
jgi:hypothetical protein